MQGVLLAVQGCDFLLLLRPAHPDSVALQVVTVKGMHGLSHLQHHVIGDIHDIGDGILSDQSQPAFHPLRRLPDFYIIYIVTDIPGTQVRRIHRHRKALLFDLRLRIVQGGHAKLLIKRRSHLPGNAHHTLTVRPVGRDRNVKNPVVQSQDGLYIHARLRVRGQRQQAVVARAGEHIFADAQLYAGTQHALGLIAPQLPLFDSHGALHGLVVLGRHIHGSSHQRQGVYSTGPHIVRAAAHLERAMTAGIHPANMQMGLGNGLTGLHQARYHIAYSLSHLVQFLHLKAAGKQFFLQFPGRHVYIHIVF